MTFFLSDQPGPVEVKARGTDRPLPSTWDTISASFQKEQTETNASWRRQSMTFKERRDAASQIIDASEGDVVRSYYAERGLELGDDLEAAKRNFMMTPEAHRYAQQYAADLDLGFDPSEEGIEKRIQERLMKEEKDARDTLAASDSTVGEVLGSIAGQMWDLRQLPFLALGGGTGSFARIVGREAMLNVAAETATLPSRFDMAKRLDIPEPDVAMTLAFAAAGGAMFGGAVEGLARGITYWRGTRTGAKAEGVPNYEQQINTDVAEDALTDLAHPFEHIQQNVTTRKAADAVRAVDEAPTVRVADDIVPMERAASPAPEVDLPRSLIPDTARDLFDQPGARVQPGERQMDLEELIEEARAREAEEPPVVAAAQEVAEPAVEQYLTDGREKQLLAAAGGNRPLISHIQKQYGGIKSGSRLAEELRARGITSKTAPGLFRQTGREGFDNIPTAQEPTLAAMWGDDGNGYLDEMALADAITDEISGNPQHVTFEQEAARSELAAIRDERERLDRIAFMDSARALDEHLFELPTGAAWVDSPVERTAMMGHQTEGLRDVIAQGEDLRVDMGDGRGERPMSSVLDELDADDEFAAVIEMCGRGRMKPMESS